MNPPTDSQVAITETHESSGPANAPVSSRRERLRFSDFVFQRTPSGQCSADVVLEWEGAIFRGRAGGASSPLGDFRVSADATLKALSEFVRGVMEFELLGIKHVRAFDANLLIVSVSHTQDGRRTRLVGCCLAEKDPCRGAALAVLNATNRVLGNHVALR